VSDRDLGTDQRFDPDRLETLYERARQLAPELQPAFLAEACGGDSQLERELRSLLAHGAPAEVFFAGLAESVVSPAYEHWVGHYRLIGILGSGGMGTVYRAHDSRLDRVVALKFLPPFLSAQPEARERFVLEARTAAALEHSNICSIHEIGETADGRPFIAMACYEGETLKQRLSLGPLPAPEAVGIAAQVARGLRAAHGRGIVHRDVKPGNIMLCADGTVRLLDFGLAKVADVSLTSPGSTPGTIAYMSPEQVRGEEVGPPSDLWSLGVVCYEMLAGVRPFAGGSDRVVVQAILHEEPAPLDGRLPEASGRLLRMVERLLRKPPAERYPSADALLTELEQRPPAGRVELGLAAVRARRRLLAVSGAGVLAAAALGFLARPGYSSRAAGPSDEAGAGEVTIAVLPFTVRGPGLEVWREGMVDLLSMGLDGAGGIRAIDSRTLLARWHQEVGDTTVADLALGLGVARGTRARYALVGSAVSAGTRIRLSADIDDVESGRVVGRVQVEGSPDSVLGLVDRLGMQILGLILPTDPGAGPGIALAGITTPSLLALKAYLQGEDHYRRSEYREAGRLWERAVSADSQFALAYLGLADAYAWTANLGNTDRVRYLESLDRANTWAARLPQRERAVLEVRLARESGNPDEVSIIREVVRRYPDAADAWYQLGEVYYHDALATGRPEAAESAFRQAAELQPASAPYRVHLLDLAYGRYADSGRMARELDAYARLAPAAPETRAARLVFALAFGGAGARARADGELDTMEAAVAAQVYPLLTHPRFAELREKVYPIVRSRLPAAELLPFEEARFRSMGLGDGQVRRALSLLDEPRVPSLLRYGGPFYLSARGLPVPDSMLARTLAAALRDGAVLSYRIGAVGAAGAAASLGDWHSYNAILSRTRELAARDSATGDSAGAGYWRSGVRAVEAHGLWRRGRKEEALSLFEGTLQGPAGRFTLWHVGQLALELGRLDLAERAFRALWQQDGTAAWLQLARVLERTGRPAEARQAYAFVAYAWRHADPELQPLVNEARQAVARLAEAPE
jgi:serine/threonine-protein kinase